MTVMNCILCKGLIIVINDESHHYFHTLKLLLYS